MDCTFRVGDGHTVNILGFAGHLVTAATTLGRSEESAASDIWLNGRGSVPVKLNLQKKAVTKLCLHV